MESNGYSKEQSERYEPIAWAILVFGILSLLINGSDLVLVLTGGIFAVLTLVFSHRCNRCCELVRAARVCGIIGLIKAILMTAFLLLQFQNLWPW